MAAATFLSFLITILFMFALRPAALAIGLVDVPGGRKRHNAAVPVIGGIAMSIGLGVGTSLVGHPESWAPVLLGVYLLVIVGTIDDRFDLPVNVRLIAQCCAALLVVIASGIVASRLGEFFGHELTLGPIGIPFTILFVMTLVNAFNVIDGLDGLAGGLALLALAVLSILSAGTPLFPLVAIAASVVAGCLLFNLPLDANKPVRAFMGDGGSTSVGLIIATVGIHLTQGSMPIVSPVEALWFVAIPIFDLFSAIVRRLLGGVSPFSPDHEHMHHVLVDNGLSRRSTLTCMLALGASFAAVGVLGNLLRVPDGVLLLAWLMAGALYYQILRFPRVIVAAWRCLQSRGREFENEPTAEQRSAPDP